MNSPGVGDIVTGRTDSRQRMAGKYENQSARRNRRFLFPTGEDQVIDPLTPALSRRERAFVGQRR